MAQKPPVVLALNALVARGGVEMRAVDLARHLVARGIPVEAWAFRVDGPVADDLRAAGARVRWLHVYDYRGRAIPRPDGFLRLVRALREPRRGAVLGLQHPTHLFLRAAALLVPGTRVVAMERLHFRRESPSVLLAERLLAAPVHAYVGVSRSLRDDLLDALPGLGRRIRAVENGVAPLPRVAAHPELAAWARGRRVLGFLGSLSARKRPRVAVEALRLVRGQLGDTVALALVGGMDDDPDFPSWLEGLGLGDAVRWFGQRSDVAAWYAGFDAFLFPSVLEGLGNVWVEAARLGLPIVSSDARPMNDYLVDGSNALLCPPDDPHAFAGAILRLLGDPALAAGLSAGARAMAEAVFDPSRQMDRLAALALSAEEEPCGA